jgi:alpha-L-fucosidase
MPHASVRHLPLRAYFMILLFTTVVSAFGSALHANAQDIGEGGNTLGFDMAPETNLKVVDGAVKQIPVAMAPGPVLPTWDSLQQNYRVPDWFIGAKFGIFIHFGIFSVPAHKNEWYEKYMYAGGKDSTLDAIGDHDSALAWHTEHFGPPERFGYKDFIPMFKAEHFDANSWAALFKKAGARYVVPGAQHHENFAMWDSRVTPFNAKAMGPKRDVIGELSQAVRKQGMKFGVANHGIENFQFINPSPELARELSAKKADLYDPKWADFYNYADRSDSACQRFLINWYERNVELIDKYQPDLIYFDNGIDQRYLDPLKLEIAAYYYNRAKTWGKQVSLTTKKAAFAPTDRNTQTIGSIIDFEGQSPSGIRTGSWEEDRPIGSTWGYTTGMKVSSTKTVISWLVDAVSKNGSLLLNVSPMSDGTIPLDQQQTLLGIGKWLQTNGEAIYDTHSWVLSEEEGKQHIYFTVKRNALYALVFGNRSDTKVLIKSLSSSQRVEGTIASVTMLGSDKPLRFTKGAQGLRVVLSGAKAGRECYVLKITGLQMNPPTWTGSGDPIDNHRASAR